MFRDLISVRQLQAFAGPLCVFDCRARLGDLGYGKRVYAQGRIPGAQHLDLDRDLASPPGSRGRHPLPDRAGLARRFAALGANDRDQLVFYDDAGGAFAARAWWLARWCGHEAAAVLDGGLSAWPAPLAKSSGPTPTGDFSLRTPLTRSMTVAEVEAGLRQLNLIDARSRRRYDGREEPIDAVAGHIPGAHCRPFDGNLAPDGAFKSPPLLRARFHALAEGAVCYCGSGVTAAHNILAMRVAGLGEAALYPGSWSEWIADPRRPIARMES